MTRLTVMMVVVIIIQSQKKLLPHIFVLNGRALVVGSKVFLQSIIKYVNLYLLMKSN